MELEREPATQPPPGTEPPAPDHGIARLPDTLRERLLAAAQINALTEIEAVLGELRRLDPATRALADELAGLLQRYDTDGIVERVNRLSAGAAVEQ